MDTKPLEVSRLLQWSEIAYRLLPHRRLHCGRAWPAGTHEHVSAHLQVFVFEISTVFFSDGYVWPIATIFKHKSPSKFSLLTCVHAPVVSVTSSWKFDYWKTVTRMIQLSRCASQSISSRSPLINRHASISLLIYLFSVCSGLLISPWRRSRRSDTRFSTAFLIEILPIITTIKRAVFIKFIRSMNPAFKTL